MAGHPSRVAAALAGFLLVAGCGGSPTTTPTSAATSDLPTLRPTSNPSPTMSPTIALTPSPSGLVHCALTPAAHPSATIQITRDQFGVANFAGPATINAGQAVAFTMGSQPTETIFEGAAGVAVANPCVSVRIAANASVIVTFWQPGTYKITTDQNEPDTTSVTVK